MHLCVGECVWACTMRMLMVIVARKCIYVSECVKVLSDCHHEHAAQCVPRTYAGMMEKYACMMNTVHNLLSIKSTAVVEESCTSLDELTLGCVASAMQVLRWWKDSRVSR